ncbi:helix-turn-helix transcriptional regulator [Pectobacterium aroidearum]|uniref:helix-turn-helix transcriptional regulator n=1 Tax=Pectobacterium aroidearum TaxID=1201031 RepID=UPI002114F5DF|nr:AraC family transcriptional regulator [Pectobacterium aroidearum]UUE43655.1 AraC family transcriptional regulator [Pectobacterium aroidearum]UUE47874.1 AraC family transcriptional regulator [Pectobacterium aroidearum]UUE52079.1 AraC family transcriptional regulator [Pectobacterium aroidearum]UUE60489.1 AraC family transcriptional regulator [Pectobacterium aroidearum]UUE64712.1 AraC family transcriptional regulator [Pectobacterium aroidearum]
MNASPLKATSEPEVTISNLIAELHVVRPDTGADCSLLRATLQEGLDILVWRGQFRQPTTMHLHDDWGRINFSCSLQGDSQFALKGDRGREHLLKQGSGCISYTPDCQGTSSYAGQFESVTVSLSPELLANWVPDLAGNLQQQLDSGRLCTHCDCNAEMRATAQVLSHALSGLTHPQQAGESRHAPLWLLGQSMIMVSLAVAGHADTAPQQDTLSLADRHKLLRAKDLLLADLSQAPTIAMLSRETGLSVLKLKRGFRLLFNNSIYGLFQAERMHEARRRLFATGAPVMVVATDLGYANASHFSAAFQKQFGVTPSAFKRLNI